MLLSRIFSNITIKGEWCVKEFLINNGGRILKITNNWRRTTKPDSHIHEETPHKTEKSWKVWGLLSACLLQPALTAHHPFLLLCSYLLCFCFSTLFFYFWDFFSLPSFMVVIHFCNLVVSSLFYSLFLRGGVVYKQTRKTGHKGDQGSVSESFKRERDHVAENCCPSQCDY